MELNQIHPNVNKPYLKSYCKKTNSQNSEQKRGLKQIKYLFELLRLYQQSKMRFHYILTEKLLHIPKRGLLMAQRSSPSPLYTFFALRFGNNIVVSSVVWFQKISIPPTKKRLEIPGGWGVLKGPKS